MNTAPSSLPLLLLILMADFAITLLHAYQEWKGAGAPLWRNFGAIVGLDISDRRGFRLFTVALTVILFVVGFIAILSLFPAWMTAFALGALIGARLSDTLISHVLLYALGYRPNPGLSTTPIYILEAIFLFWFFEASLTAAPGSAWWGFACGFLAFVLVLPSLWIGRWVWPQHRRLRWRPWEPVPAWAKVSR